MNVTINDFLSKEFKENPYRLTPVIISFYEGVITGLEIKNLIEIGINIVRFRVSHNHMIRKDKLELVNVIRTAQRWVCEKHNVSTWPVGVCVDIPNASIRTGHISSDLGCKEIWLSKDKLVTITSDKMFKYCVTPGMIFIDDEHTLEDIEPGLVISLCGGGAELICTQVIDKKTKRCKITHSGPLRSEEYVALRGLKLRRPPLGDHDLEVLKFAIEMNCDIITVLSVRFGSTVTSLRKACGNHFALFLAIICEQEGIDNIDEILEASDGIILAREILTKSLENRYSLAAVQMQISAKCMKAGKPFYIMGNILDQTLKDGTVSSCDISDITNAVLQGAGFVFRQYSDANYLIKAAHLLNDVCKSIESYSKNTQFWRLIDEYRSPVNAAEACLIGCALMAKQVQALVIILPTVSGRTASQLTRMSPSTIVVTISRDPAVARRLQIYRGVLAVTYDKPSHKDRYKEIAAQVDFGVKYCIQRGMLSYGSVYVTLAKSSPYAAFPDSLSVYTVTANELKKHTPFNC